MVLIGAMFVDVPGALTIPTWMPLTAGRLDSYIVPLLTNRDQVIDTLKGVIGDATEGKSEPTEVWNGIMPQWELDLIADFDLEYGNSDDYGNVVASPVIVTPDFEDISVDADRAYRGYTIKGPVSHEYDYAELFNHNAVHGVVEISGWLGMPQGDLTKFVTLPISTSANQHDWSPHQADLRGHGSMLSLADGHARHLRTVNPNEQKAKRLALACESFAGCYNFQEDRVGSGQLETSLNWRGESFKWSNMDSRDSFTLAEAINNTSSADDDEVSAAMDAWAIDSNQVGPGGEVEYLPDLAGKAHERNYNGYSYPSLAKFHDKWLSIAKDRIKDSL
jgi:hypothetical protein